MQIFPLFAAPAAPLYQFSDAPLTGQKTGKTLL